MTVPPPGGGEKGHGYSESEDIDPPETEYGRAICCDAANFWDSVRGRSGGGGTRVPQRWWEQPGIDWRLAREQNERAEAAGETYTEATAGKATETTETETPGS